MLTKLRMLILVLRNREMGEIVHDLKRRFWSTEVSYCLRRDLAVPFAAPRARASFALRELQAADRDLILKERPRRLPMLNRNVPTCYIAASEEGDICYMQWLMGASANEAIRKVFAGCVPPLQPDEALMEFAYTFAAWRGKNIMSRAMALIAEQAQQFGGRYVMTFVREENVPALKGCQRAGFQMYRRQAITWRLFFRSRIDWADFPTGTLYPFEVSQPPTPATVDNTVGITNPSDALSPECPTVSGGHS